MSQVILNIKGTSGSGKTTTARNLLSYPHEKIYGKKQLKNGTKDIVMAYKCDLSSAGLKLPVYLLGSYEGVCGGCDTIPTQSEVVRRAMEYFPEGHVFLEGLLTSKSGPAGEVTVELSKTGRFIVGWIDTPIELCIDRVIQRRKEAGNDKAFNPKNTIDAWESARSACVNIHKAGMAKVVTIPHQDPFTKVLDVYKQAERE